MPDENELSDKARAILQNMRVVDPRQEYAEQQEQKRLAFEADQEQKRQNFEAKLETQKARRDWMMLIITFAAVAAAYWTGWEAHKARLDTSEAVRLDERPFVNIVPNKFNVSHLQTGNILEVPFKLSVVGKTPAFALRLKYACGWNIYQSPRRLEMHDLGEVRPLSMNDAYDLNCEGTAPFPFPISDYDFLATVQYQDFFHLTHTTSVCYKARLALIDNTFTFFPCPNFSFVHD